MAYCNGCGNLMAEQVRFCEQCGTAAPGAATGPTNPGTAPGVTIDQVSQQAAAAASVIAAGTARAAHHAADRLRTAAEHHAVLGGGAISYDEHVIAAFAATMYRRAFWTVIISVAIGLLIGFLVGAGLSDAIGAVGRMRGDMAGSSSRPVILAMALGGAWGYWIGTQKAFWLKFAAQVALCQVQIERNTRS